MHLKYRAQQNLRMNHSNDCMQNCCLDGKLSLELPAGTGPKGLVVMSWILIQPHLFCALKRDLWLLRPLWFPTVLLLPPCSFLLAWRIDAAVISRSQPRLPGGCSLVKAAPAVLLKSREILSLQNIQKGELLVSTGSTSQPLLGFWASDPKPSLPLRPEGVTTW